ncbi:hypothetical protein [Wolbachia endosymbiont (group A) of Pogonocherus hispidulus]|uniref:hypothetical protein n=1 Tax=Wolbachia endosymbiont (group A) of Pogonocherus hispidulus TaxID=3066136 RepID=UPI003340EDF0
MDSPNVVKFDGTPFDNKQTKPVSFNALKENVMLRELFVEMIKENGEFFNSNFSEKSVADMDKDDREEMKAVFKETGNNDLLDRVLQVEASMAVSKAMKVGVVCGVIAALVVGGGCFAAGAQLSILAIAGIAVAAALAVGIVAGGITYAVLKPSNKLDEPDSNKVASVAHNAL